MTWKNDYIFKEFSCPNCQSTEHKQIPKEWTDTKIVEYHENWFFCLDCGIHTFFEERENKTYA
jgi:hypothetical protein